MSTPATAEAVSEDWQARLHAEWQALESKRRHDNADDDQARAALLTTYHAAGKTARQIEACIHLSDGRIGQLLCYQRWLDWLSSTMVELKIPERQFRAYYHQVRDPRMTWGKRRVNRDYEDQVFARIMDLIKAGQPPMKPGTPAKVVTVDPPEPHQPPAVPLRPELTPAQRVRARKEVHEVEQLCAAMYPDLKVFARLMKGNGREWAPTVIAWRAERITQSLKALEGYMKGLKFAIDWDSFDADPA